MVGHQNFGYYTKKNILPLSESIRRLTSLPAERLGTKIEPDKKGFKADLTVMDYEKVESTWSIREPENTQLVLNMSL